VNRNGVLVGVTASLAAIATLAGSAYVAERREAVDPLLRTIVWGSGRHAAASPEDMVLVPGGSYIIGDDDAPHPAADAPRRSVRTPSFLIDRHEVTNAEFARFIAATAYVTTAEREGAGWIFRGGDRDWSYVAGADWRHPLGAGSSIEKASDHPVVLVSWYDASAYAKWAGKRLPTEAEWEVAARGGLAPGAEPLRDLSRDSSANVWQGRWPQRNEQKDSFFYTAPVASFAPNRIGLYDMLGNVWEWTADGYGSSDTLRVARGGSWFCSRNYCSAYRPGFRGKSPADHAFNNVGFRCVIEPAAAP
jgi:formylglycine-generating enzyme required for sulfatase activity